MTERAAFEILWRRRLAQARRRRFAELLAMWLPLFGAIVVVIAVSRWWIGADDVIPISAWGWSGAAVGASVIALLSSRPDREARSALALKLEQEQPTGGALLAAAGLLEGARGGRLAPLVFRDADACARITSGSGSGPLPTAWLVVAAGLIVLTLLLPTVPAPWGGGVIGINASRPTNPAQAGGPGRVPVSGGAARRVVGSVAPPDLGELVHFQIDTDRKHYLLGEDINLTAVLRPLVGMGEEIPLDVVIGLGDGMPSRDVGFGSGIRPVRPGWAWTIPAAPGESPRTGSLVLNDDLQRLGMYKVGLFTLTAYAAPEDGAGVSGGLVSNSLKIEIGENRLRRPIRKPEPVDFARSPRKPGQERDRDKEGRGHRGGAPPKLGPKQKMERAQRRAKVVKPLLSDGPWKEKEVEVFERERGGSGRPPVAEPKPGIDAPVREFLRREEKVIEKLPLRPEDRRILKLYLEAIRRRG